MSLYLYTRVCVPCGVSYLVIRYDKIKTNSWEGYREKEKQNKQDKFPCTWPSPPKYPAHDWVTDPGILQGEINPQ